MHEVTEMVCWWQTSERKASEHDNSLGELTAMFPDVDIEVIGTILTANGGSMQRSIDALLSMSDPGFGAQQQAPTSGS